jgi:Tfp pilus assembly protein PilZ
MLFNSERRHAQRFKLSVPLVFCSVNTPLAWGHSTTSIDISEGGVFFNTKHPVFVGLPVRVLLKMPKRFPQRECSPECLFTGRVTHIETKHAKRGSFGVGIEFFYTEPVNDKILESVSYSDKSVFKRKTKRWRPRGVARSPAFKAA